MSHWSPKPLRDTNLNGIFQHDDHSAEAVVKSETPNRWAQQRSLDGTPHTIPGASALTPPPAGPRLVQADLEKAMKPQEKEEETLDGDAVVKAYLAKGMMDSVKTGYNAGKNAASKVMSAGASAKGTLASAGATAKGCGPDDEDKAADDLEKSLAGLRKYL